MAAPWTIYAHQLFPERNGHALWEPNPGDKPAVELADVGYLKDGAFVRLFNASKGFHDTSNHLGVPERYEPLRVGEVQYREPLLRRPDSIRSENTSVEGADEIASGSVVMSFECQKSGGAALIMDGEAFRQDAVETEHCRRYIIDHHRSWLSFAKRNGCTTDVSDLILVTGCDKTSGWACAAFSSLASANLRVGDLAQGRLRVWGDWERNGSVYTNEGPKLIVTPTRTHSTSRPVSAPEYIHSDLNSKPRSFPTNSSTSHQGTEHPLASSNQCVFVRGFRVCDRMTWLSRRVQSQGNMYRSSSHECRGLSDSGPIADSEDSLTTTQPSCMKDPTPLGSLLDYILERSGAELAVVHDDDLIGLLKDTKNIDDYGVWIRKLAPQVYVDDNIGMLEITYTVSVSGRGHRDESVNAYNRLQPSVSDPTGQIGPGSLLCEDGGKLCTTKSGSEVPATTPYRFSLMGSPGCSLISRSSASQYTDTSSPTIPGHGIGSFTAKGIRAVGKIQLRAAERFVIWRNLVGLRRLFPHTDDAVNHRQPEAYDTVLELTRPHLYSDQIRKEALRLVLPQIAGENVAYLVKALIKLQPVEVQMFVAELMTCLPPEWVGLTSLQQSRRGIHADLWQNYYLLWTKNGCIIAPILKFIRQLAQESSACCQAIVEGEFLGILMDICFRNFHLPNVLEPLFLRRDDPKLLEHACNSLRSVLAAGRSSSGLLVQHNLARVGFLSSQATGNPVPQATRYFDLRLDFVKAEFERLQAFFPHTSDATIEGLDNTYDNILDLTRPGLYSHEIRKQALGLVLPQIAIENTGHIVRALTKWPPYEVQIFVTEVITCLPPEWLKDMNLRLSRQEMHADLWQTSYVKFLDHGRIIIPLVAFVGQLAQENPPFCRAVVGAGFDSVIAYCQRRKFTLPCVSVTVSSRHDDPEELYDVCNSVVETFATDPNVSSAYQEQPLHKLWPTSQSAPIYISERQEAWRNLGHDTSLIYTRLEGIRIAVGLVSHSPNDMLAIDALVDILEFAGSEMSDFETSDRALEILSQWMEQKPKDVSATIETFMESNCDGTVELVSRFFSRAFRNRFYLDSHTEARIGIVLTCFLAVATGHPIVKQVLIDAGLLIALFPEGPQDPRSSILSNHSQFNILKVEVMQLCLRTDWEKPYHALDSLLTMPSQYTEQVHKEELGFTLRQIASGNTANLIKSCMNWPPSEVQLFVTELLSCLPHKSPQFSFLTRRMMYRHLWCSSYLPACAIKHSVMLPFMNFIHELVKASSACSRAVVEAGLLDLLMDLCIRDFRLLYMNEVSYPWHDTPELLRDVCVSIMITISSDPLVSTMYLDHPLHSWWPIMQTGVTHLALGPETWKTLRQDPRFVAVRLEGLRDATFLPSGLFDGNKLTSSDFVDLFEFASSDALDPHTSREALDVLIFRMRRYLSDMPSDFRNFIESNHDDAVERISRLVSHVLSRRRNSSSWRLKSLVTCFIAVAVDHPTSKQILVDAGFQSLLLAVLPDYLRKSSTISSPPPCDKRKAEAAVYRYDYVGPSKAKPNSRHAAPTIHAFFNMSWPQKS